MAERKRRTRFRAIDADIARELPQDPVPPSAVPVLAPEAVPVHRASQGLPTLTRATQEFLRDPDSSVESYWAGVRRVVSRRPGDSWRERMTAVWSPAGTCTACERSRYLLRMTGQMAVCDLRYEVSFLREHGFCTCSYDDLEHSNASH